MRNVVVVLFSLFVIAAVEVFAANPFLGVDLYVNPTYISEVQSTIDKHPDQKALLQKAQNFSSAYWIDTIARIDSVPTVLEGAKAQQAKTGRKVLTVFVVYDLPNRDCAAAASNGELLCEDSTCTQGLNTYKTKYIDPIVAIFRKYPNQPIVAIVEPDSLGNLATNLNIPKCQQAQNAYKQGIAYAIQQLSELPNLSLYLDSCHGGWLGWDDNRNKIAQVFNDVLNLAGGQQKIRGFAVNTANYQPLGSLSNTDDPCHLEQQYNHAIDESHFINLLTQTLSNAGISGKGFIIDTSRNGVTNMRKDCSNWCNINHSGLGRRPSADTQSVTGLSNVDAFYWIKVPGESDGTSNSAAQRYDFHCGSQDSFIPAPEAGQWFDAFFVMLCQNANPPL